jgi:hypothetical protein
MDQHDGGRNAAQPPAKDFLALTHGQEWVSFYESFDKLVQDHLSRSSELLRRAMSLPEVADREVAQVRAEMEGKLAAERERSFDLLSRLHSEISQSRDHVSTLADSVKDVAAGLTTLSSRVSEAIASLDVPAAQANQLVASAPVAEPMIEAAQPTTELVNDYVAAAESAPEIDAQIAEGETDVASELAFAAPVDEPIIAEPEVDEVAAVADAEMDFRLDSDAGLDLTALAEAEATEASEPAPLLADDLEIEAERPQTGALDDEVVGVGAADRPRPHWLSVTRIGSRP